MHLFSQAHFFIGGHNFSRDGCKKNQLIFIVEMPAFCGASGGWFIHLLLYHEFNPAPPLIHIWLSGWPYGIDSAGKYNLPLLLKVFSSVLPEGLTALTPLHWRVKNHNPWHAWTRGVRRGLRLTLKSLQLLRCGFQFFCLAVCVLKNDITLFIGDDFLFTDNAPV